MSENVEHFEEETMQALSRLQQSPYDTILLELQQSPRLLTIRELHEALPSLRQSEIADALRWMYEWNVVDRIQHTRQEDVHEDEAPSDLRPPHDLVSDSETSSAQASEDEKPGLGGITDTYWRLTDVGALLAQQL